LLENSEGLKENLAEKLVSRGFTLSFYTTGIDLTIDTVMRKAIDEKKGIFTLRDEVFTYPFRPWDVRKLTTTGHTGTYDEYREILNTAMDPNLAWIPAESSAPLDGSDEDGAVPKMEGCQTAKPLTTSTYYLKEESREGHAKINSSDWRNIEHRLDEKCNAQFETVCDQMVIKVRQPFVQTYDRVEVFVNYGGLKEYWIPLILENQSNNLLLQQMTKMFRWLNESRECSWTTTERRDWIVSARENFSQ
jgi:hypothetical protein